MQKPRRMYVDNNQLLDHLKAYRTKVALARAQNRPDPLPSDAIGKMVMLICLEQSSKSNFHKYPHREEMVGDAILACTKAIPSFNPDKSSNPFGYFSLISWRAMIKRIDIEKEELYVKMNLQQQTDILGLGADQGEQSGADFHPIASGASSGNHKAAGNKKVTTLDPHEIKQKQSEFMRKFEEARARKRARRRKSRVDRKRRTVEDIGLQGGVE